MTHLLDSTPRDQARLLEQSNSIGHAFMSVPPNSNLHYTMSTDNYTIALRFWLGMEIHTPSGPGGQSKCPGCQMAMDTFGDHLLCCRRNNFVVRHMAVQDTLAQLLQEAGQGVTKEVPIPSAGSAMRPADLLITNWSTSRDTAVNITDSHG